MGRSTVRSFFYILLGLMLVAVPMASAQTLFKGHIEPTWGGVPYEGGLVIKAYYGGSKPVVAAVLEPCTLDNDLGVGCVSSSGDFFVSVDRQLPDAWYYIVGVGAKSYAYGYVLVTSGVAQSSFVTVRTYTVDVRIEKASISFWQTLSDGRRLVRLDVNVSNTPSLYGSSTMPFNIFTHFRVPVFVGDNAPVADVKQSSSLPSSGSTKTVLVFAYLPRNASFYWDAQLCATVEIQNQLGYGLISTREVCAPVPPTNFDDQRVENVKRIRDAVEAYYRDKGSYPTSINFYTMGSYLSSIPVDPLTGMSYPYAFNSVLSPSHYHIWADLENPHLALSSDSDLNSSGWSGGNRIDGSNPLSEVCSEKVSNDCIYDLGR